MLATNRLVKIYFLNIIVCIIIIILCFALKEIINFILEEFKCNLFMGTFSYNNIYYVVSTVTGTLILLAIFKQ